MGFEDSVRVSRSEMIREGIPKRRARKSKTTRGKSNVNMRLGEELEVFSNLIHFTSVSA